MKYRLAIIVISSIAVTILLAGCSPWVVIEQGTNDQWMTLSSSTSVGQTFVADYSGLHAVYFTLTPKVPGAGTLIMHLRSSPGDEKDILQVSQQVDEITTTRQYRFDFPAIENSDNQYYYSLLTIDGDGSVAVGYGPAASYQEGSAYYNNQPVEGQVAFSLDYDRLAAAGGILQQSVKWACYFILGILLLCIPGWAIMSLAWKGWQSLFGFEKFALSIGVSLAFYALFAVATYLFHLQLGKWYAWLPLVAGAIFILWKNRSRFGSYLKPGQANFQVRDQPAFWADLSLLIILGMIAFSRFWAVRNLFLPMWNDSLHHTEITQLILDNHGLFSSWMPYAAFKTFSMHFGFPLSAALFSWISGLGSGQSVIIVGQLLNILAPLALYPVVLRLTHGNRLSGVVAVLAAGLLSPMPAYYINWGRYAQLAGQVMLPVIMWMMWNVIDDVANKPGRITLSHLPWVKIILAAAITAGMVLFELRMIFVVAVFAVGLAIARFVKHLRVDLRSWLKEMLAIVLIGILSIAMFLPWGLRLGGSKLITYGNFGVNAGSITTLVQQDYQAWLNIRFYLPPAMIILSLIGFGWAIIKKDWLTASIGLWVGLMASLYSLIILHVPWVQYMQSFAVLISLYIPVGIFIGYLAGDAAKLLSAWLPGRAVIVASVIIFCVLGAWNQRGIAKPELYSFITQPDLQAMQWIKANTPQNSKFLVEGMHENWVTNVIGTDAGWWIPLLAGRENTIPPQYALSNEQPIESDYSKKLVDLQAKLEKTSLATSEAVGMLCDNGITHVYIGEKQGSVGPQAKPLFTPDVLSGNPVFRLIYHNDRVYIYSVENACSR